MILNKIFFKLLIVLLLVSCAEYKTSKTIHKKGKTFYSSASANRIQTSDWDSGVYFISLKDRKQTLKVIKIK